MNSRIEFVKEKLSLDENAQDIWGFENVRKWMHGEPKEFFLKSQVLYQDNRKNLSLIFGKPSGTSKNDGFFSDVWETNFKGFKFFIFSNVVLGTQITTNCSKKSTALEFTKLLHEKLATIPEVKKNAEDTIKKIFT